MYYEINYPIIEEYDEETNTLYQKFESGLEMWHTYDDDGRLIYTKDGHGLLDTIETWFDYDDNGNIVHDKRIQDFSVVETWHEYNEDGNKIHSKSSTGYESWNEWSEDKKLLYFHDTQGLERVYKYNEDNPSHKEERFVYKDGLKRQYRTKNKDGLKEYYEYDKEGKLVRFRNSKGYEEYYDDKEKVADLFIIAPPDFDSLDEEFPLKSQTKEVTEKVIQMSDWKKK